MKLFGKDWYRKHQRLLLAAANIPIPYLRWQIREKMGAIHVPESSKIVQILGDKVVIKLDEKHYKMVVHPRAPLAKDLMYNLMPLWKLIHRYDMRIANRLSPSFNLGFDTLTVKPDADPESTTVDGFAQFYDGGVRISWASIIDEDGNLGTANGGYIRMPWASGGGGGWFHLTRAIFLFDCSSLPSGFEVSSAKISTYNTRLDDDLNFDYVSLVEPSPDSNTAIIPSDFNRDNWDMDNKLGDDWVIDNMTLNSYNATDLNTEGISRITSGIVKLGAVYENDFSETDPGSSSYNDNKISCDSADTADGNAPKFEITYTLPTTHRAPQTIITM